MDLISCSTSSSSKISVSVKSPRSSRSFTGLRAHVCIMYVRRSQSLVLDRRPRGIQARPTDRPTHLAKAKPLPQKSPPCPKDWKSDMAAAAGRTPPPPAPAQGLLLLLLLTASTRGYVFDKHALLLLLAAAAM